MVEESIIFAPDIDERALNREVSNVNRQLDDAGHITPEIDDAGGFDLGELSGGGDDGGFGGAAGAGALASRIPKPIAGVTASAAMPVALAGGVGIGMLSAMHGASARLQTSTTLLGQAWNNVWRPIGDRVDELFVRDAVMDLVSETQDFEEALRDGRPVEATVDLAGDLFAADAFGGSGSFANMVRKWVTGGTSFSQLVTNTIIDAWPGWPDIGGLWPGWPNINLEWPGWPDISVPNDLWPSSNDLLRLFPSLSVSALRDRILGIGGGGDDTGRGPRTDPTNDPSTGPTRGPRNNQNPREGLDIRTPREGTNRFPSPTVSDTEPIEDGLDRVERAVKDMNREFSNLSINVGQEEIGRVVTQSQNDAVYDTDPTV